MATIDLAAVAEARQLAASGEARRIRLDSHVKLTELAAHLNKTPATLSRWEAGIRSPNARDAVRWIRALRRLQAALTAPGGDAA